MDYVKIFDTNVNSTLESYLTKPTLVRAIIHLLLVLYVVQLAPVPPPQVLILFTNIYFKLAIFILVLYTAQFSPSISILVALAFLATINYSTRGKFGINGIYEMLDNVPATPVNSLQAIQQLNTMANSSIPVPVSIVTPITTMALTNASTQDAINAINTLSNQAMLPSAGSKEQISIATQIASENITSTMPSPTQSVNAINILANAAMQPDAIPISTIMPIANAAMSGVSTPIGASAVQSLINQASSPSAGTSINVDSAVKTALMNISDNTQQPSKINGSTDAIKAVHILGEHAISNDSVSSSVITPIANIAASGVSTPAGLSAIQMLASQSISSPGTPENVISAVQIATADIRKTNQEKSTPIASESTDLSSSGCYPMRNYDMSKVIPMQDGKTSFEDWQNFNPSLSS